MPDFTVINEDTGEFRWHAKNFASAGQNSFDRPPGQDPDYFERLLNVMPVTVGSLDRRWGFRNWTVESATRRMVEYSRDADLFRRIITIPTPGAVHYVNAYKEDGTFLNNLFIPDAAASLMDVCTSRDILYACDGVATDLKQWDPVNGVRSWGGLAPSIALSVTPGVTNSGHISLTQGRRYYLVFRDTTVDHYSDLSPISNSTGITEMANVTLGSLQVSTNPRFNRKVILATADGEDASILYFLADLPMAQTTYVDDLAEEDLLLNNLFLETDDNGNEIGVAGNQPPPNGTLLGYHAGRLAMIVGGQYLRVSKSFAETISSTGAGVGRFEECWPPEYELDISPGAETVKAWLSDGSNIWIGTNKHIRRIAGTGPDDWQTPELAFNNVGVLNQDVWKIVYLEGTPQGSMWLTPDFRVIGSDFNNYKNAGAPIQDVLDTINPNRTEMCHAITFSSGAHNFYALAIPTGANTYCDTICLYDLKKHNWFVWTSPHFGFAAMLSYVTDSGKPLWLASVTDGSIIEVTGSVADDKTFPIPVTIRTPWYSCTDPQMRKLLQELEVMTGDPDLLVTIEGASTTAEFDSPSIVVQDQPLTQSLFGEYKVYLAGLPTVDRFYRITFKSLTGTVKTILDSFSLEGVPFHTL